ncbi:MAG: GTPase domain-containing protein [Paracoccaceae bacterium]
MAQQDQVDPRPVPVLALVGKSGAGKTSVIRALTGEGQIGSGFAPETRESTLHSFPAVDPAVWFLDTRGLGEAGLDPAPMLAEVQARAQAVLAVMRMDDPVQDCVAEAVAGLSMPVLGVLTGGDLVATPQREAARARAQRVVGGKGLCVELALPSEGMQSGIEPLLTALDSFMPHAVARLRRAQEEAIFATLRPLVRRYASAAAAGDVVPLVGLGAVPAAQGAMLYALAAHYKVTLTPARLGVLASALGTGALVRMGTLHVLRQGAKAVPVVGQTLGAAAAAGASFATTYALGRAASAWLYGVAHGTETDAPALRALYESAMKGAARDGL